MNAHLYAWADWLAGLLAYLPASYQAEVDEMIEAGEWGLVRRAADLVAAARAKRAATLH